MRILMIELLCTSDLILSPWPCVFKIQGDFSFFDYGLKTLDTIGKCQRPSPHLGVYQHIHKITNL